MGKPVANVTDPRGFAAHSSISVRPEPFGCAAAQLRSGQATAEGPKSKDIPNSLSQRMPFEFAGRARYAQGERVLGALKSELSVPRVRHLLLRAWFNP